MAAGWILLIGGVTSHLPLQASGAKNGQETPTATNRTHPCLPRCGFSECPDIAWQVGDKIIRTHRPLVQKIHAHQDITRTTSPTSTTICTSNSESIFTRPIPLESALIAGHFALKLDCILQDLGYLIDPFVDSALIQLLPAILNGLNEVVVG